MPSPSPRYYATDAQIRYLRLLLDEAFAHRYPHRTGYDRNHLGVQCPREGVSAAIDELLAAKARGWTAVPDAPAAAEPADPCEVEVIELDGGCRVRASVEGRTFEHSGRFDRPRADRLAALVRRQGRSIAALTSSELWAELA